MEECNDHLILLCGPSAAGKTSALEHIEKHESVLYLNCESNKKPPFRNKFINVSITDPYDVYAAFEQAESNDDIEVIIIDTLTFLMEMFVSKYIVTSEEAFPWGPYSEFFKNLMQQYVSKSTKKVIFLAHTKEELDKKEMVLATKVPVSGSLKNLGVESFFSTVLYAKRIEVDKLEGKENDLMTITEEEEEDTVKYVIQTRLGENIHERIRAPRKLFKRSEIYIDSNIQTVLNALDNFYS